MRDYGIDLTKPTLFLARVVRITRRDGQVLRLTDAEEALTIDAETFVPVAGGAISAVRHTLGGEVPSLEISFAHADGGAIDTFDVNAGFYDGATVQVYLVERTLPARPEEPGDPVAVDDDDYAAWLIAA